MAENLGSVVLGIDVDPRAAEAGLNQFRRSVESNSQGAARSVGVINNAFTGLGGILQGLAGVAGVVGIGALTQQIIATGQASERSKIQLQALAGAYGEAAGAGEAASRIQRVLGISALSAREGFAQLYAALRGTGIGLQQLEVLFVGISNAARLSGAGTQEAQAALLQLKQGLASGTLQGDELRSVLEQLPAFAQAVADQLNVNVGRLRQLGSEGKITSDIVFNAAKQLATATAPGRTQVEQLGIAFTNLREAAAEAFGPGLVSVISTVSAGIAAFSKFLKDNQEGLLLFGRSIVEIGKTLVPLAAGILAVRAAFVAYQIAAKGAAVAQAAVLALSGPKGWALLATGVGLTAAAAVGLEKVMGGIGAATQQAKAEAEQAMTAFKGILEGTTLKPADNSKEMESWAKRIAAANKLKDIQEQISIEAQRGSLDANAIGALQALASFRSAVRAEQDAQAKLRSDPKKDELINASREAAENTRLAAAKAKQDLLEAFRAAQESVRTISRGIEDSTSQLLRLQGGNGGINQFLNGQARFNNQQQAFQQILPLFRQAREQAARDAQRSGNPFAAQQLRTLNFSGDTAAVNQRMLDFIEAQRGQERLQQDLIAANQELVRANTSLAVVMQALSDSSLQSLETNTRLANSIDALATKDWSVQINVAADGSSAAYGDVLNGALTQ